MGCGGSKEEPEAAADPKDVKPSVDGEEHGSVTQTGFHSDVEAGKKHAFTEQMVTNNVHQIEEIYDLTHSTTLGRGACGQVSSVTRRATGEMFAMKTVSLEGMAAHSMAELRQEIAVQKMLDHPNIVRVFETFEDPRRQELHIIMEMCTGGALVSRMKTHRHGYGEKAAATLVEKMMSSTMYCHKHGVVHRDIKLDNFIYEDEAEDSELKLIDFGFASFVAPGKESMWDQIGTPSYMAPELWSEKQKEYDSSVDMWALGVVTYMLLSGKRPFHSTDRKEKARMICHDPLRFPSPDWDRISDSAKDFCSKLMQKVPKDRMNASDAVHHPWIKQQSSLHQGEDAAHELERHGEIVDSLAAFSAADDLKRVALEVVAFSTPPAKLEELRTVFVKMDEDDSGTLSLGEFKKAMALHPEIPMEQVEKMFHDMDITHSGEVDYTEFLAAANATHGAMDKPSITAAFSMLDRDGDGTITKIDLVDMLGRDFTEEEIDHMIIDSGATGGVLTFAQFKTMMLKKGGTRMEKIKDIGKVENMQAAKAGGA